MTVGILIGIAVLIQLIGCFAIIKAFYKLWKEAMEEVKNDPN